MFDRRAKNAEIFLDTKHRYTSDPDLITAVRASKERQQFIGCRETVTVPDAPYSSAASVTVSSKRSLEAAMPYAAAGKKVCVHNFASATNPGGGVVRGSSAQEEAICRCTTLYPCLDTKEMWNSFYTPHRNANDPLYNDDCIYTPRVYVIKSDIDFPKPLPKSDWQRVDILTCAAPNLREKPSNAMNPNAGRRAAKITEEQLRELLTSRVRRIFEIAAANKAEVLILGAFGCGAFCNPPKAVAEVFRDVMKDFLDYFETVEYAVYHRPQESANYEEFKLAMREYI